VTLLRIVTLLIVVIAACTPACSQGKLRMPERALGNASRTDETAVVATHPPPAALPEIISLRPSKRAQWLPGTWIWQWNSWVWERGGWIENPERLRLIESQVRYTKEGTVEFCPRRWVDIRGETAPAPAIVVPAATPPTPELREEHTIP
jgi:hypothetical protein